MVSDYEHPTTIDDLVPKMKLRGTVSRVELFGAFVDIGLEQDGLVHIADISPERVKRVADVLAPGDEVTVWVKNVEADKGRIGLTMIEPPERTIEELRSGMVLSGTVTKLMPYGAFVDIGVGRDGLVHISEMSSGYIRHPSEAVQEGEEVMVRVLKVNRRKGQIQLSMKDLPLEEGEEEEEEEEPLPTAMELALQEALAAQKSRTKTRRKKRKAQPAHKELDELYARTLQQRRE